MNEALFCGIPNQRTTRAFGAGSPPHRGRDSSAVSGTLVYASGTGVVSRVTKTDAVYGYRVEVTYHTAVGTVVVGDGHLSRIDVVVGQGVDLSTVLGRSGGIPGTIGAGVSRGQHLHEDTIVNGILTDPDNVLTPRALTPSGGNGQPITETETDMKIIRHPNGQHAFLGEFTFIQCAPSTATDMAAIWGPIVVVTDPQWVFQSQTSLANRALLGGGTGGLTPAQDAKLTAIPSADSELVDEAELGAALTSDVSLTLSGVQTKLDAAVTAINQHTDQKFDGLTLSTP